MDTPTTRSIKNPESLLAIFSGSLYGYEPSVQELVDDLEEAARTLGQRWPSPKPFGVSLESVVEEMHRKCFIDLDQSDQGISQTGKALRRFRMFTEYTTALWHRLPEFFSGTVPIFVDGQTITFEGYRAGIDWFSNNNLASTITLSNLSKYQDLDALRLIIVHPFVQIVQPVELEGDLGWRNVMADYCQDHDMRVPRYFFRGRDFTGPQFGSQEKYDDHSPSVGTAFFTPGLLSLDMMKVAVRSIPELIRHRATRPDGVVDYDWLLARDHIRVQVNRHLMAHMFARVFDAAYQGRRSDVRVVPRFMAKGSGAASMLEFMAAYAKTPLLTPSGESRIPFIGGDLGIFGGEKMAIGATAHGGAQGRLMGYVGSFFKNSISKPLTAYAPSFPFRFVSGGKFPMLLLEDSLPQGPTIHDMAQELLSESSVQSTDPDEREHELINRTRLRSLLWSRAQTFRKGWSRLEPLMVQLLTVDRNAYRGFRNMDRSNVRFLDFTQGSRVLFPSQVPGLFGQPEFLGRSIGLVSDIRGSEYSLPTNPHFDHEWVENARHGIVDAGDSLEKVIATMDRTTKNKIVLHMMRRQPPEVIEDFCRLYGLASVEEADPRFLDSEFTLFGTFIHALSNDHRPGLAHYRTWELAGLEPVSSDQHTELSFRCDLGGFTLSFHPDELFFLERHDRIDTVVPDIKTNRHTLTPKHPYTLQTAISGVLVNSVLRKMGYAPGYVVTTLAQDAFYAGFDGVRDDNAPHGLYRPQKLTPPHLFAPDHFIHWAVPLILRQTFREKQLLLHDPDFAEQYCNEQVRLGRAQMRYPEHRLVAAYFDQFRGTPLVEVIEEASNVL